MVSGVFKATDRVDFECRTFDLSDNSPSMFTWILPKTQNFKKKFKR